MLSSKELFLEESFKKLDKLLWGHVNRNKPWEIPQARITPEAEELVKRINTCLSEYNYEITLHHLKD